MKYYATVILAVEADNIQSAEEKIKKLEDHDDFSEVYIEDGPQESADGPQGSDPDFIEEEEEDEK
jgi:hypothetical protein